MYHYFSKWGQPLPSVDCNGAQTWLISMMWNYFCSSLVRKIIAFSHQSYVKIRIICVLFERNSLVCKLVKIIAIFILALKLLAKLCLEIFLLWLSCSHTYLTALIFLIFVLIFIFKIFLYLAMYTLPFKTVGAYGVNTWLPNTRQKPIICLI